MIDKQVKGAGYLFIGTHEIRTVHVGKSDWYRTSLSSFRPLYGVVETKRESSCWITRRCVTATSPPF